MGRLFLFLLLSTPFILLSQSTKSIKSYYPNTDKLKEAYTVSTEEETIKHGVYIYYFINQKIRLKGQYHLNEKDGEWKHYNDLGEIRTIEYYNKGVKTGIWLDFMERGGVVKRYDWDHQKKLPPYLPSVTIEYPDSGREAEIEGEVQLKFLLDEDCGIKEVIPIKTLGKDFEKAVIVGYQKVLSLSKKYDLEIEGCDEGERIFSVNFVLN